MQSFAFYSLVSKAIAISLNNSLLTTNYQRAKFGPQGALVDCAIQEQ
jgi:hypothetical protein